MKLKLMEKERLTVVNYIIIFEDKDREIEYFTNKEAAFKRIELLRDNWNCHLFNRILSV